uniref:C-type lectin domain-containing protein n=1 Tax=Steinernema glaseri TaxID=37863 RepID=A0A1I8AQM3_9BILA
MCSTGYEESCTKCFKALQWSVWRDRDCAVERQLHKRQPLPPTMDCSADDPQNEVQEAQIRRRRTPSPLKPRSWRNPEIRSDLILNGELCAAILLIAAFVMFAMSAWETNLDMLQKKLSEKSGEDGKLCTSSATPPCSDDRFSHWNPSDSLPTECVLVNTNLIANLAPVHCCNATENGCPCGYKRLPDSARCFTLVNANWTEIDGTEFLCPNDGYLAEEDLTESEVSFVIGLSDSEKAIVLDLPKYEDPVYEDRGNSTENEDFEETEEEMPVFLRLEADLAEGVEVVCENAAWTGAEWWVGDDVTA